MYNLIQIDRKLEDISLDMGGVFTRTDLILLFEIPETPTGKFDRIIKQILNNGILYRFCRNFYVREKFSLKILSQK